jgi:hypothetical protein
MPAAISPVRNSLIWMLIENKCRAKVYSGPAQKENTWIKRYGFFFAGAATF